MNYDWDINKINNHISKVKQLYKKSTSKKEKAMIKICLNELDLLKKAYTNNSTVFLDNFSNSLFTRYIDR